MNECGKDDVLTVSHRDVLGLQSRCLGSYIGLCQCLREAQCKDLLRLVYVHDRVYVK